MRPFEMRIRVVFMRGAWGAWFASLLLALLLVPRWADAQGKPLPTRHTRDAVSSGLAAWVGRLPADKILHLSIALPLRNESELDGLLEEIDDPRSANYQRFLSVEEFTERFGPSREDYEAVIRFAREAGLTVTGTAANRMVVDVAGPAGSIERAFHVALGMYQHPTEARTFFAPDREPAVDLPVALWHITGLENYSIPHPAGLQRRDDLTVRANATGSGPGGDFLGSDMRAAYYGGTALTGHGESVGLVEFGGFNVNDVRTYFSQVGQALNVRIAGESTDGSPLACGGGCDDTEQALDIEQAISMAPGLLSVRVYVSDTSDVSILNRMASDNASKSLSCSWGWSPADPGSDDPIFKEFRAQGQTFLVSSGDNGSYDQAPPDGVFPADDAWVTSVGGTSLTTAGPGGAWQSEVAWVDSGGGESPDNIVIPSWQKLTGVITPANQGSTIYRNGPDVAAEADFDNYICYNGTCGGGWGGTSFSAPRWAGYVALLNEYARSKSKPRLGFISYLVYQIGLGPNYHNAFHDITSGSNGTFSAVPGYDLVTGWGSPTTGLLNYLHR